MLVFRGLWDKDSVSLAAALDEMVGSNIRHDLGAGQQLDMELCLELVELLEWKNRSVMSPSHRRAGPRRGVGVTLSS